MKREKSTELWIFAKHLDRLERSNFCDFEKLHKCAHQKVKIESNEQTKVGANQIKFEGKSEMLNKDKSFQEVDYSENRQRALLGFVKAI